jgi:hypothetical protein
MFVTVRNETRVDRKRIYRGVPVAVVVVVVVVVIAAAAVITLLMIVAIIASNKCSAWTTIELFIFAIMLYSLGSCSRNIRGFSRGTGPCKSRTAK